MKILFFVLLAMVIFAPVRARPCDSAQSGCINCDEVNTNTCNRCDAGLRLSGSSCQTCAIGTGKGADTQAPGSCNVTCTSGCSICGATPDECLACKAGYYFTASTKTCTLCPEGFGRSTDTFLAVVDTSCTLGCDTGCAICDSIFTCVACQAGYRYSASSKQCILCSVGTGRMADTATRTTDSTCDVTCHPDCKVCGAVSDQCLGCSSEFSFSYPDRKCTKCPDGTLAYEYSFASTSSTICYACNQKCATCQTSTLQCQKCKAGFSFTLASKTCTDCPSGKGRAADTTAPTANTVCDITCDPPCEFCSGQSNECLGCKAGFRLDYVTKTCSVCPAGTTKAADTAVLFADSTCNIACAAGCSLCSGTATNCLGCQEGFKYDYDSKSCSACPPNSGRAADTEVQTGPTLCNVLCDPACSFCGAEASKCLGCKDHNKLDWATKTCSGCSKGSTRATDTAPQFGDTICDVKCAFGCTFCSGTASNCYGCSAGFYYTATAFTCATCAVNTGRAEDTAVRATDSTCNITCAGDCLFCAGTPTQCVGCPKGFRLAHLQKQCFMCSGGRGRAADTSAQPQDSVCNIECVLGCDACQDTSASCVRCDQGYYLSSTSVCTKCPAKTGKPKDIFQPAPSATNGAAECSACHVSCYSCKGPLETDCLGCAAGFYRDQITGKCPVCGKRTYSVAEVSYNKYPATTSPCINTCDISCEACSATGAGNCLSCARGYYWAGNGVCTGCPSGSGKVADAYIRTTAASNAECDIPCHDSCKVCFGPASNHCLSCKAGYGMVFWDPPNVCNECSFGSFGKAEDPGTVTTPDSSACGTLCDAACLYCTGPTSSDCLQCRPGFYLSAAKTCTRCPLYKGKLSGTEFITTTILTVASCDIDCHFSCKHCSGPFINQCYSCRAGFYGSALNRCDPCPSRSGKPEDVSDIVTFPGINADPMLYCTKSCHETCLTCSGTANTECVLCMPGRYKTVSGTCELCRPGYGKPADTVPIEGTQSAGVDECYIPCHSDCVNCFGPAQTNCLNCAGGHFFESYGTCTACQLGKGKPADPLPVATQTTSAIACTATCNIACLTCSGNTANDCLKCNKGYFRSASTTCSLCPIGSGKAADNSIGLPSTDGGKTECNVVCNNVCGVCENTLDSGCLSCKEGFYYSGNGLCSGCLPQKGKLADTTAFTSNQGAASCDIVCDPSCESCNGTEANKCVRCKAGMYLQPDGTCSICRYGKGKPTDAVPTSPTTDNGQTECSVTCDPKCHTCSTSEPTGCLNCGPTYWWSGAGVCTKCTAPYTKDTDTSIVTQATFESWACTLNCAVGCQVCQGSSSNCLYCNVGFYFSAPGTCTLCAVGTGKGADNGVVAQGTQQELCTVTCHHTCQQCFGPASNECLSCIGGYYLASPGVCTKCTFGKGSDAFTVTNNWPGPSDGNMICRHNCHAVCSSCYEANSATSCTGCSAGYYYSAAGVCSQCDLGYGKPADTSALAQFFTSAEACTSTCDISCLTCKGAGVNDCIRCAAGYYLLSAGTCSLCRKGFGKTADNTAGLPSNNGGTTECAIPCHETCGTCSGPAATECLSCIAGFYWSETGVCTQCDNGTGKLQDSAVKKTSQSQLACTVTCHEGCLICSSTSLQGCVKCAAGYFYSNTNTCEMCPFRKGKAADTTFPTIGTSDLCTVDCDLSCRTCSTSDATNCLNCVGGFYYSAQGKCSPCPANTGKPEDLTIQVNILASSTCTSNCDSTCFKCKGSSTSDCLNCNDGYFLSSGGSCLTCPETYGRSKGPADDANYPVSSTSAGSDECAQQCHTSCKMCKDSTAAGCVSCAPAHFYSAAGVCTLCPSGTGKMGDDAPQTSLLTALSCNAQCTEGCQNCLQASATSCLSCKAGYYRSGASSCTVCPADKGGPGSPIGGLQVAEDIGCPATCHHTCKTCSGPTANDCIKCKAGHFLVAKGTCSLCPFGLGKLEDNEEPSISSNSGKTECNVRCHISCRTCTAATSTSCLNCRAGHFWESGSCTACPATKGKPADTVLQTTPQTEVDCSAQCHRSCKTCGGTSELDCASCSAGFWWSGLSAGTLAKCEDCPKSRGKSDDTDLFPISKSSPEACNIYCDLCTSGCLTCSENATGCLSCIPGKYLTAEQTCADCPENCLACSSDIKCNTCEAGFELTSDSKQCLKCQVKNCAECKKDPFKCTKCADKFTLKSDAECFYEPKVQPLALDLSYVSITENPQLTINLLENKVEFPFSSRESQNFVSITVEDKLDDKVYTCAQLGCTYAVVSEKLKFEFNSELTIRQGRLKIDRGAQTSASAAVIRETSGHKNSRLLQTQRQESYFIVVDGVSLMKKSRLTTAAFATRIIVGILRLPLSLLVFWKYPQMAMLMDLMVTQLKLYSLINQPFMAYAEVVYQSVSDSKILPFNFINPFQRWNSATLDCVGFLGIRSKNMYCSFFDNYGENMIGLASVALTCIILIWLSKKALSRSSATPAERSFWGKISQNYGTRFLIAKFDANHVEIALMTLVAYSTADHTSKSVVGIVLATFALLGFGLIAKSVCLAVKRVVTTPKHSSQQGSRDTDMKGGKQYSPPQNIRELPVGLPTKTDEASPESAWDSEMSEFAMTDSSAPLTKWSVYFFAARYVRALLLSVFVATVRDPVEQVVLVVVLESVYLVALILFDFRGSRLERGFHTAMHSLMLLHLILRAVATSKSLSDRVVQSTLATAIVVILMVYIFSHVVAALLVLAGIFRTNEPQATKTPAFSSPSKILMLDGDAVLSPSKELKMNNDMRDPVFTLPAAPPMSYRDLDIPDEMADEPRQDDIPREDLGSKQPSKIDHIRVRVDVPKPTAPGTQAFPLDM